MSETINKERVLAEYNKAGAAGKKLLVGIFGEAYFVGKLIDRINTMDDVFREVGEPAKAYAIPTKGTNQQKADAYMKRLLLLERVFSGGWVADMADTSQNKYYAWFDIVKDKSKVSGFGLSFGVFGYDDSASSLGARPYFKDSATATHVGKKFLTEYEGFLQYENLARKDRLKKA